MTFSFSTHRHIPTQLHTQIPTQLHTQIHTQLHTHTHANAGTWTGKQTDGQTESKTQANRGTDRQTISQTNKQTETMAVRPVSLIPCRCFLPVPTTCCRLTQRCNAPWQRRTTECKYFAFHLYAPFFPFARTRN